MQHKQPREVFVGLPHISRRSIRNVLRVCTRLQLRKAEAIEKTSERDIQDYSNQRDQIEVRSSTYLVREESARLDLAAVQISLMAEFRVL